MCSVPESLGALQPFEGLEHSNEGSAPVLDRAPRPSRRGPVIRHRLEEEAGAIECALGCAALQSWRGGKRPREELNFARRRNARSPGDRVVRVALDIAANLGVDQCGCENRRAAAGWQKRNSSARPFIQCLSNLKEWRDHPTDADGGRR